MCFSGLSVTGCDTLPRGTLQADIRTNTRTDQGRTIGGRITSFGLLILSIACQLAVC